MCPSTPTTPVSEDTTPPSTPNSQKALCPAFPVPSQDTGVDASGVPGVKEHANPRCQCACVCYNIVRNTSCIFCNYCLEHHVG
ncbi:hypothetical protein ACJZ2D_010781 [Fusarium nematophilum]